MQLLFIIAESLGAQHLGQTPPGSLEHRGSFIAILTRFLFTGISCYRKKVPVVVKKVRRYETLRWQWAGPANGLRFDDNYIPGYARVFPGARHTRAPSMQDAQELGLLRCLVIEIVWL